MPTVCRPLWPHGCGQPARSVALPPVHALKALMVADGSTIPPYTRPSPSRFNQAETAPPPASVGLRIRELIEFGSYYLTAQVDRLKLTAINVAMFAILGLVVAFVGVAVVLTAGVLLVVGIADMLGALFGGRVWLGQLVTSVVILGAVLAGVFVVFKTVLTQSRKKVVASYEQRKSQQRADLGTDVREQAQG